MRENGRKGEDVSGMWARDGVEIGSDASEVRRDAVWSGWAV